MAALAEEQKRQEEAQRAQDEKDSAGVQMYLEELTFFLGALPGRLVLREEEEERIRLEQEQREQERQRRFAERFSGSGTL